MSTTTKRRTAAQERAAAGRLRAATHPTRIAVLRHLSTVERASPKDLAGALDEGLSNVSYHVRHLLDGGFLRLVATKPRRGALEHFYEVKPEGLKVVEAFDAIAG
jgi:DNA-binding transcriptional ArsR family regulator